MLLSEAPSGKCLVITQVPDRNSEMLAWLSKEEIILGKQIEVVGKDKFADNILIKLDGRNKRLGFSVANKIHVRLEVNA